MVVWLLLADLVIIPAVIIKLSFSMQVTPVIAATIEHAVPTGPATESFMQSLRIEGLNPIAIKGITRKPFTSKGSLITIGNDNIQVFEYPDNEPAMNDAAILAQKYASSSRSAAWKNGMHVYVKNSIAVFYMGKNDEILKSLDSNAGVSLTHPDHAAIELTMD